MISEGHELLRYERDAPRALRRARVRHRNEHPGSTFSMVVRGHVVEIAGDLWEPSDEFEREAYRIEYVASACDDEQPVLRRAVAAALIGPAIAPVLAAGQDPAA